MFQKIQICKKINNNKKNYLVSIHSTYLTHAEFLITLSNATKNKKHRKKKETFSLELYILNVLLLNIFVKKGGFSS